MNLTDTNATADQICFVDHLTRDGGQVVHVEHEHLIRPLAAQSVSGGSQSGPLNAASHSTVWKTAGRPARSDTRSRLPRRRGQVREPLSTIQDLQIEVAG